jgi:hypothetical protein
MMKLQQTLKEIKVMRNNLAEKTSCGDTSTMNGRNKPRETRARVRARSEAVAVAVMEELARPRVGARCCTGRARWWCAWHCGG